MLHKNKVTKSASCLQSSTTVNKYLEALEEIERKNIDGYCLCNVSTQKEDLARRRSNTLIDTAI